jgi:putative hydrolase of the HAD superfamily
MLTVNNIKAVSFDLWGTLIHESLFQMRAADHLRISRMQRILIQAGYPVGTEPLRRAYHETWRRCETIWSSNRDMPTHEQVMMLLGLVRSELPRELDENVIGLLEAAYVQPIFVAPPGLDPIANSLLTDLKAAGLRLGLICNTGRTPGWALRKLLRAFDMEGHFSAMLFSNEEGVRKPSPQIFQRLLERLGGLQPGEVIHVGDDPLTDVRGAIAAGLVAILLDPEGNKPVAVPPSARIASLREMRQLLALSPHK